jgi:hypothetical protein
MPALIRWLAKVWRRSWNPSFGTSCPFRSAAAADEVKNLSDDELHLVFALSHATEIRAAVDHGDDALRSELEKWEPQERATLARALAELG